ncbi:hypothetical protein NYZ99_14550 [Maribacter litopenaei]|uniref:Outer membrane protein beta-barrel domain-containing protein n=1 Tax=Maribacter litopenaei TaxID=2976127 RepID=A0ABY5Y6U3_9FLAO|nr:hypothetical protein [Maribacter litopenaei]UWX54195.1 hypothetical protein NYZ99_14550 [Maribacter litopenaei]
MRTITMFVLVLATLFMVNNLSAQEDYEKKIKALKSQKEQVTEQEKEALKVEVEEINRRLRDGLISSAEAKTLKEAAAEKRALNIENRLIIIENQISLLERNEGVLLNDIQVDSIPEGQIRIGIDIGGKPAESFVFNSRPWKRELKYDRRTYSDFVLAAGLNNAIIEGQSLNDTPYQLGGSRFFEIGWQWRTRVFQNSNFLRLNYGFSFQFNGLKMKDNQYFVLNDQGNAELQPFEYELDKSKFRMDNLVFPVHLEFDPSKFKKTEKTIRYSLHNQFRLGIGAYGGFNIGTRQKLKYDQDGNSVKDKLKRDYNTNNLIYGLSAYAGFDGVLLYLKYDLNPIFKDATIEQRNVSLGLRFDL